MSERISRRHGGTAWSERPLARPPYARREFQPAGNDAQPTQPQAQHGTAGGPGAWPPASADAGDQRPPQQAHSPRDEDAFDWF